MGSKGLSFNVKQTLDTGLCFGLAEVVDFFHGGTSDVGHGQPSTRVNLTARPLLPRGSLERFPRDPV